MFIKLFVLVLSLVVLNNCASNKTKEPVNEEVQTIKKEVEKPKQVTKTVRPAQQPTTQAAQTAATIPPSGDQATILCKNNSDERRISVLKTDTGCSVQYEKFGNQEEVATAQNRLEHCPEVQDKIRNNLNAAGFECNEVR